MANFILTHSVYEIRVDPLLFLVGPSGVALFMVTAL